MYTSQPKKMLIIDILDILKKYSDEDHRLSQRDIIDILKNEYDMTADRKAVKRNLMNLIDYGYDIEYSESTRLNKKGEEETMYTDWYMVRDFTDEELRLLIDGLLFSKNIPTSQCKDLIVKLECLSNKYFKSKVKHIANLPENMPKNDQLFYTISILDEAIGCGRQVSFIYNNYDVDKRLHPRQDDSGDPREYIVNPYQMVATNGRYYLIGNYNKYNNISHYRIDRITNIELLDMPVKAKNEIADLKYGLDLPKHMAEHIYMFSGESKRVTFTAPRFLTTEIIDWFGKDVTYENVDRPEMTVKVMTNVNAMEFWALQYCRYVKVVSPAELAESIKKDIEIARENYEEINDAK